MHGSTRQAAMADADATPSADYAALIGQLRGLEKEFGNYRLLDINRGGDSGYADAEYGDFDHLNLAGSRHLSRAVDQGLQELESRGRVARVTPAPEASGGGPESHQPQPPPAVDPPNANRAQGDKAPPKIKGMFGDMDYAVRAYPPDNRPTLWAEYTDEGSGIDLRSVRFFIDDADVTARCEVTATRVSYTPAKTLAAPKLYRLKVVVCDTAGNRAEFAWQLRLKPC
jgi:hypothetical protein